MKGSIQSNGSCKLINMSTNQMGSIAMKKNRAIKIAKRIKELFSQKTSNSPTRRNPECDFQSGFCSQHDLIQNYANFRKSASPSRFMFYSNDAWNDFSEDTFRSLKAAFDAGVPTVEVLIEGSPCLFDFHRMSQIYLATGQQRSIAWIDVNERCFFPKLFTNYESSTGREAAVPPCTKLEIEIKIDKAFSVSANNSLERKNCSADHIEEHTDESPADDDLDILKRSPVGTPSERKNGPGVEILRDGEKNYMAIKNLFLNGIRKFDHNTLVTSICKCSHDGPLGSARLETFQRQIEMTKAARGSANVRFAWYGTPAKGVASVVMHGFGQPNRLSGSEAHGVGVHLSPHHLSYLSASLYGADDNGEKHVILCRVVTGNAEKVEAGSVQFHPSTLEFDIGMDDLVDPKWYIVWSTHMNSHILPEYVVSFKSSNRLLGVWRTMGLPEATTTGSRILFPKLFSELRKSIPSSTTQALECLYTLYKGGKMSKDVFIRQVRLIVGDNLLISTIQRFRGGFWNTCNTS